MNQDRPSDYYWWMVILGLIGLVTIGLGLAHQYWPYGRFGNPFPAPLYAFGFALFSWFLAYICFRTGRRAGKRLSEFKSGVSSNAGSIAGRILGDLQSSHMSKGTTGDTSIHVGGDYIGGDKMTDSVKIQKSYYYKDRDD